MHDAKWAVPPLLTGLIGFGVAAALWWIYFDVAAAASARQLEEPEDGGPGDTSDGMVASVTTCVPIVLAAVLFPYPHGWLLAAVIALVATVLAVAGTLVSRRPKNVPRLG